MIGEPYDNWGAGPFLKACTAVAELRQCSAAARGVWFEIAQIVEMKSNDTNPPEDCPCEDPFDLDYIVGFSGLGRREVAAAICELEAAGALAVLRD